MNLFLLFLWQLALRLQAADSKPSSLSESRPPPVDVAVDNGTHGYYPTDAYATEVDLNGPQANFIQWSKRCNDGLYYFISPRGWGVRNPGPMILDERGKLIWAKHFENNFGGQAYNFAVQNYKSEEYLTFWLGDDLVRGHGSGNFYMLDASYNIVRRVGAANGLSADLHEFVITPEGTALLTVYEAVKHDLTGIPDYNPDEVPPGSTYIWDCLFQEIDLDTEELVHEWRASDHLNVSSTFHGIGPGGSKDNPFDWFHINSVQKDELGNFLVSARYTHSIMYIDGQTNEIIWTLGGRMNNFMDLSEGSALNFAWQHDARFVSTDAFPTFFAEQGQEQEQEGVTTKLVSLFDNAAEDQHYEYGLPLSRGLLLEVKFPVTPMKATSTVRGLELKAKRDELDLNQQKVLDINGNDPEYTVRVVRAYENPQHVRSSSQGSLQILSQGQGMDPKVFIGYGLNAVWSEFDANGTVLCDVHYGALTSWERGDIQSYRAYKLPWVGRPNIPPAIDLSDDEGELFVSWNGATEVTEWVLQCSDRYTNDELAWKDLVTFDKEDFETAIGIPEDVGGARYLRVIALDNRGGRLEHGVTDVIDRGVIASYFPALHGSIPYGVLRTTPFGLFLGLVIAVCTVFLLLGLYRRLISWKTGKHSIGAVRWRRGPAYQLLGDAQRWSPSTLGGGLV